MLDLIDMHGVVKAPDHLALANPKLDERQLIESVNDTLKGHLDLELHSGRTIDGLTARIAPRVPAVTAATAYGITLRGPKTPPPGIREEPIPSTFCFPAQLATAGTWDPALLQRVARASAMEIAATGIHLSASEAVPSRSGLSG